jgi:myo-inositol-1-phosphate synthase
MIKSNNAIVQGEFMTSNYVYQETVVEKNENGYSVTPVDTHLEFKTELKVAKTGLLLVGWGGNNGSTLTAALTANKLNLSWNTKEGTKVANYFGSLMMASTTRLGIDSQGKEVYVPFSSLLPMVHPNDLVISGWDINSANLCQAMQRAQVLDWDLQEKLKDELKEYKPLKSIYYPDFIAANQTHRADNLKEGIDKSIHLEEIRTDIRWDYLCNRKRVQDKA